MNKTRIVSAAAAALLASALQAQEADTLRRYRLTTETVWLTAGHHHSYDAYLSSQLYQGAQLGLGFEQQRLFSASYTRLSKYCGLSLKLAADRNQAQNHRMLTPRLRGLYGAHYHLPAWRRLRLMPGAYTNVDLGVKYLPHNGNNPANAIASTNFWLSAIATFSFRIGATPIKLTDHASLAACGLMFSPHYTQLYYDIQAIDGINGHMAFTHPGNRLQWRNEFAADVPLGRIATVRLGMVAERLRYDVSRLQGRNLECLFKLGLVRHFYTFRGKEPIPNEFISAEQ